MKPSISGLVLILLPLVLSLPFAMDIYVPAVPHLASLLHVTANEMQLTLTLFMFSAGFLQLIIGPVSDHYGRKLICFICIIIFTVGTLLCSSASSLTQLILYRVIQAAGSCGMLVLAFAIVRDIFSGTDSAKCYSYLNGMIAFSPMFAPFIGSYLDVKFGWPDTFRVLIVFSILSAISIGCFLKESLTEENKIKLGYHIFQTYKDITKNSVFSIYTFFSGVGLSYLYLFCSISSYIIIRQLHIPEIDYGYYFCFMGISFFIGGFLSGLIVGKIGIYNTVLLGFIITLIGGSIMAIWYSITGLTIDNFIWPMLLIGIGGTFAMGAGNGGAMEPFEHNVGAASALSSAFRFVFAALLGTLVIGKEVTSTLPLAIPAIIFSIAGLIVFSFKRRTLISIAKTC